MNIDNFKDQNEFNGKILEILENHFTYEENSRQMVSDLSANLAESTRLVTKLAKKVDARDMRFSVAVIVLGVLGYKKIKSLEERVEKLEAKKE